MPDKPTKIAHQYACLRGTAEHVVKTGEALEREIRRACDAAKERAYGEIDASTKRVRDDYEQNLRAQTQLKSTESLAPRLQAQLASL